MYKYIRKLIPAAIKQALQFLLILLTASRFYFRNHKTNNIFIIGSPNHGNCGDIAIVLAEKKFLLDHYKTANIFDINMREYDIYIKVIKTFCSIKDIFILTGGGNFGSEYLVDENIRRDIIQKFPNNKIVMFPQSIYFHATEKGQQELKTSQNIYTKHNHLTLTGRDCYSCEIMRKNFTNNVLSVPDIVLYLEETDDSISRRGVLICLRNDLESILTIDEKERIPVLLKEHYNLVKHTDNIVPYDGCKDNMEVLFKNKLSEFQCSEIVITDRIHGLIFSAITSTPCIVISNYNHKIKGMYQWIKHLDYIKYAETIDQIPQCIIDLKKVKHPKYSNKFALPLYDELVKEISHG